MSVFISLAILALALLLLAFLYLTPGVLALFHHYSYGRFSKNKAQDLCSFFIIGAETTSSFLFLLTYIIVTFFTVNLPCHVTDQFTWIMAGLLLALAFSSLLFYFRPGKGSELFISRKLARDYMLSAATIRNRSGAFCLGVMSKTPELLFSLPLYIIISNEILRLSDNILVGLLLMLLCILTPAIPLFIIELQFRRGYNLATIQRSRVHNKDFTRVFMCISYSIIAILIMYLKV